jgi:uncharacterized protein YbbC (DUF1343 family)
VVGLDISHNVLSKLDLHIVKTEGWNRDMTWQETNLEWIPSSPRIKCLRDILDYVITAPLASLIHNPNFGLKLRVDYINERHFGNICFYGHPSESYETTLEKMQQLDPDSLTGCSTRMLKVEGKRCLLINVVDIKKTIPALFALTITAIAQKWSDWEQVKDDEQLAVMIKKHIGDNEFIAALFEKKDIDVRYFRNKWKKQADEFIEKTKSYYLYK